MHVRRIIVGAATAVLLSSLGVGAQEDAPVERILFVGNSFTSFSGGVDHYFAGLVATEDDPPPVVVDDRIVEGATLREHLARTPEVIRTGSYSIVVLQGDIPWNDEHSVTPFFDAARTLDGVIRESGGQTVFYMTWPYASAGWIDLDGIVEAHRLIGDELDAAVAPVAVAMVNALADRPELAMIGDDGEHQTVAGAYLAAATIYATIFDRSPEGLLNMPDGLTRDEAAFLQRIAWESYQQWQRPPVVVEAAE